MKFVVVLLCWCWTSALIVHANETTTFITSQDKDTELQTHLGRVPDVDAQNYYNKNINQAFRFFRPDLETNDEKLKEKYGVEFLPTLLAKQQFPTESYQIASAEPEIRVKRDAGAVRFGEQSRSFHPGFGPSSASSSQAQSITAAFNFGPFGASISSANAVSQAHSGGFGGFGGGSSAASQASANSGSFGGGGGHFGGGGSHASAHAESSAIGLTPPPLHHGGHYGGYPSHGHYPSHYDYGHGHGYGHGYNPYGPSGYNPYGHGHGYKPNAHYGGGEYGSYQSYEHGQYHHGHGDNHYVPQYHQNYPGGGLYGGGPAGHYPSAYEGYGRSGKVAKSAIKFD